MADPFDQTLDDLKQLRDELKLKAHLAGKDLADFLDRQDVHVRELTARVEEAADEVKARAPEVKEAATRLLDEVREAARAARARLSS